MLASEPTAAQQKPNIVIIWGDDIGQSDLSMFGKPLGRRD